MPSRPAASPVVERLAEAQPPIPLLFSLKGRIDRRTYWQVGVLGLLGTGLLMTALLRIAGLSAERAEGVTNLLLAWPAIALSVKRWHDRNRSGAWVLINLVPLVGWLWGFIDNGFLRGDPGDNRYGPAPVRPTGLL